MKLQFEVFRPEPAERIRGSKATLIRHRNACLSSDLLKAKEPAGVQSAASLMKKLRD
jgi:hypothetical protein